MQFYLQIQRSVSGPFAQLLKKGKSYIPLALPLLNRLLEIRFEKEVAVIFVLQEQLTTILSTLRMGLQKNKNLNRILEV